MTEKSLRGLSALADGATAKELAEGFQRLSEASRRCDELFPWIKLAFDDFQRANSKPWPWRWFALRRWRENARKMIS